jgi:anti-sigma B factor antagonist
MVWLSRAAVVTLPVEIDISNAGQVREDLLSALNRGAATLIVDMGGTTFCDSAGVSALVRAHKRATASGTDMRLVVSAPGVLRVLAITGVDHLMDVYPSIAASLHAADRVNRAPGRNGQAGSGNATAPVDPEDRAVQPG